MDRFAIVAAALVMLPRVPASAEDAPGPKAPDPDPALLRALDAVEAANRKITSLSASYARTYTVPVRPERFTEQGTLLWKRVHVAKPHADPKEQAIFARWEGEDKDGPILTLVRDREMTVWRGEKGTRKKEFEASLDDSSVRHASAFDFPLLPRQWRSACIPGGPETSPEYDSRYRAVLKGGIPACVTFKPRDARVKSFKMISLSFDADTGLAYRLRLDTYGWELVWMDIFDWKVNPEIPDVAFHPPAKEAAVEKEKSDADKAGPGASQGKPGADPGKAGKEAGKEKQAPEKK